MRNIMGLFLLLLVASCSQLGQMSLYSVSERQLEQMLSQQIPKLTQQANVAGIPLKMAVEKMAVQIGPEQSNVIRINTAANATLSLFGLNYPASIQLQVEGAPFYDAEQKAIFVRSVKLLDSSIEASGYRGNLTPVTNELLQIVNQFLATNPVYRLDTQDPTVKLLTAMPVNMAVQQGRIVFSPAGK
jgi:hypothetical protein